MSQGVLVSLKPNGREGPLISVKCLSEISLDREEEAEGNVITYLESGVYIRQENILVLYLGKRTRLYSNVRLRQ